ncbi:MAG: tRNA dihydrouridine synthase DusB [Halochromatium sp.]
MEPLRIGSVNLPNRLFLAPMAGVTDQPFRGLCRALGAGLAVSEMVSANPALRGTRKSRERRDHRGETGPIAVQIAGADPQQMAAAARDNVERGAELIDINLGCPARKVCKVAAGSALLRDEVLVGRILEAVVRAVDVPVTLKTRTGWSPQTRNLPRIAAIAEASGIRLISVHGRTRACGYRGEAEFESLAGIRAQCSLPLVANGDIDSPAKALQVLNATGADAIMIGRAALGRPWIFGAMAAAFRALAGSDAHRPNEKPGASPGERTCDGPGDRPGERPSEKPGDRPGERLGGTPSAPTRAVPSTPSPAWIEAILMEHLDRLYRFYGEPRGVLIARKHIGWYLRALGSEMGSGNGVGTDWSAGFGVKVEHLRSRLMATGAAAEQQTLLREYFQHHADAATERARSASSRTSGEEPLHE